MSSDTMDAWAEGYIQAMKDCRMLIDILEKNGFPLGKESKIMKLNLEQMGTYEVALKRYGETD